MNRRQLIGSIGFATAVQAAPAVRNHFLGVWRLISCERKSADGRLDYPYGEKPVGRLTYDKVGRMSAQLMRPDRRSTMAPGVSILAGAASYEELREAVNGFIAYFGTFDVDESTQTVIHHGLPRAQLGGYGFEADLSVQRQPHVADGRYYDGRIRTTLGARGGLRAPPVAKNREVAILRS